MSKYNTVFKRYEKKYLLTKEQYKAYRERIEEQMIEDEYGLSTICNIYYDTEHYDLIRESIEKPIYKEKLRLRSYGVPKEDGVCFLEVKKKFNGIVYKRRVAMPLQEAKESLEKGELSEKHGQIGREINFFLDRYKPFPRSYLAYDRIALYGREDKELRMTFDFNIRSREEQLDLAAGDEGELLLPDGEVILEIKVADAYPFWLIEILEDLQIYPASFSKYGNVYKKYILPEYLKTLK